MLASSTSLSSSSLLRRGRDEDLGKPSTCHVAPGQRNVRGKEELSRRRRRNAGGYAAVKAVLKCPRASKLRALRSEDNTGGRKITRGFVSLSSARGGGVRGIGANASKNESPSSDKEEEEEEDRASKENDTNKIPSDVLNSFSEETEEEKFETNRRRNFSLVEFTKRRVALFLVVMKTVFTDVFKAVGAVLKTRLAKFVLSAAFFVGSGLGIRSEHAKRHPPAPAVKSVPYSTFLKSVQKGEVTKVRFEEGTTRLLFDVKEASSLVVSSPAKATMEAASKRQQPPAQKYMKRRYQTRRLPNDLQLIPKLEKANVEFSAVSPAISTFASKGALATAFVWLPIIPLLFWLRGIVRKQNGLQDGKKKKDARDDSKGPKTTFKDVAGVDRRHPKTSSRERCGFSRPWCPRRPWARCEST